MLHFRWFSSRLGIHFGANLAPNLGLCWEFFLAFLALKMGSYLEVLFASIFHRFQAPLEPQKLSSRVGESQILHFLYLLS